LNCIIAHACDLSLLCLSEQYTYFSFLISSRQEPYVLELDIFGVSIFQYVTFAYTAILSQ